MIEEFEHTATGELVAKDPLAPFKKAGTRVQVLKDQVSIGVVGYVGKVGVIDEQAARYNRDSIAGSKGTGDYSRCPIWANYNSTLTYCYPDMLKVIS